MTLDLGAANSHIDFGVGNAGGLGNGAFTMLVLWRLGSPNSNTGLLGGTALGLDRQCYGLDTNHIFGQGDFSSGFGTLTPPDWYWLGLSKPAGAAHYRGHFRDYSTAGAWSHGEAVGAGNHTDPGVSTGIQVGSSISSFTSGNGGVAVAAVWTSVLADLAIEAAATSALADLLTAAPQWAAKFNVGFTTAPIQDLTAGGGNETSRSGTLTETADPPGYSFALGVSPARLFLPFFR